MDAAVPRRRGRRGSAACTRGRGVVPLLLLCGIVLLAGCTGDGGSEDGATEATTGETTDPDTEPVDGPVRGGTLRVGLLVDPVTIDPRFLVDDEGEMVIDALFDPLVRIDAAGEVVPAAAQRWEIDEEGRRFTFHLREATFHDGTPVTAADFQRTFDHIADATAEPPSFLAYLLADVVGIETAQSEGGGLAGVEVEDERTLTIELRDPQPGFLFTLADPSLVPVPRDATRDPEAYAQQPIGNGPFAMAGPREPGSFLRLVRAADHHDPAWLDEVLFTLYDASTDDAAQWGDLLDGQLHVAQLAPARREEATELFGRSSDGYAGPGVLHGVRSPVYLYGFDTTRSPYDDPRLRRAISLAIDRQALAEEVAEGTRLPATSLVPPGIPAAQPGACAACVHDPDAAQELLEEVIADLVRGADEGEGETAEGEGGEEQDGAQEAGTGEQDGTEEAQEGTGEQDDTEEAQEGTGEQDDTEEAQEGTDDEGGDLPPASEVIGVVTLSYNRGTLHGAIAERMAADIADALDLEVEFQAQDLSAFIRGVRRGDLPVFRHGWDVTEPTAVAYLHPLFHSSQVGLDNLTRFEDAEVDAMLDRARAAESPVERRRAVREAERLVLDDLPAIPVLWYRHDAVIRPEVRDLTYSALGRLTLRTAWFDPDADNG